MPISRDPLSLVFSLLGRVALIKLSLLVSCIGSMAYADASQPCPPLAIEAACSAQGTPSLSLRASADAPANLSYLISLPAENVGAMSLAPGGALSIDLPSPSGRQITLAVVGLEPEGGDLAACCLSNQRVHLPASCAPTGPDPAPTLTDLGVDLSLSPDCTRQRAAPVCQGSLTVTGEDGGPVRVTLSTKLAETIFAPDAECSAFAGGQAVCSLPVGRPLPFDLALSPASPRGPVTLCAELGIGTDGTARTLALQDALSRAGYPVGAVDGALGPATLAALGEFVADAGLPSLTTEIPPEVLLLLGIADFTDANPDNNRACAVADVPKPPLLCDARTTRAIGEACACRFKGMVRATETTCACKKGTRLGKNGCEVVKADTADTGTIGTGTTDTDTTDTGTTPACDPATTVLRGGVCECRAAGMVRLTDTACAEVELRLCPDGSPQIPGIPCAPDGPSCSRVNDVGECCDDLPAGDASCR